MNILLLTASPFFGGPERQMIGLADTLRNSAPEINFFFASFWENGNCQPFLNKVSEKKYPSIALKHDFPRVFLSARELRHVLAENKIDLVLSNGHKARFISWLARFRGMKYPIVGISRGWTAENRKILLYNKFDFWLHKKMDHIVAVSEAQADKVRKIGVPEERITTIRNAIQLERFPDSPDRTFRTKLEGFFSTPPRFILGAAGRFSPEKDFSALLDAVKILVDEKKSVGLVLFGDGFLRAELEKKITDFKLSDQVKLPGFTDDLDKYLPCFDLFVQSSTTEGLPNVLLESMAAQTAVVATDVGGTPEIVENGVTGVLVPTRDPKRLAAAIAQWLNDPKKLEQMGLAGRKRVKSLFTFEHQAEQYCGVFQKMVAQS